MRDPLPCLQHSWWHFPRSRRKSDDDILTWRQLKDLSRHKSPAHCADVSPAEILINWGFVDADHCVISLDLHRSTPDKHEHAKMLLVGNSNGHYDFENGDWLKRVLNLTERSWENIDGPKNYSVTYVLIILCWALQADCKLFIETPGNWRIIVINQSCVDRGTYNAFSAVARFNRPLQNPLFGIFHSSVSLYLPRPVCKGASIGM